MIEASDTPLTVSARTLSSVVSHSGVGIAVLAKRFMMDPELIQYVPRMRGMAGALHLLDEFIRTRSLNTPSDRRRRGKRSPAELLISTRQNLERAGFRPREIANLVVAEASSELAAVKNVEVQLRRYRNVDFRTRHHGTPDA